MTASATHSCLYRGKVWHRRHGAVAHGFSLRMTFFCLDLAELDSVFAGRWLWSTRRLSPMWFRRADYLGPAHLPLRDCVLAEVLRLCDRRPTGAVRMLTLPRAFGVVCNPVTFYYCFDDAGQLDCVLAEITNTPWGERHRYAVARRPGDAGATLTARFAKTFHVSPFLPMELDYVWRFSAPGDELTVAMVDERDGSPVFEAGMALRREPITAGSLARALLRHPWPSLKVLLGIYGHALLLFGKRAPFFMHPRKRQAIS